MPRRKTHGYARMRRATGLCALARALNTFLKDTFLKAHQTRRIYCKKLILQYLQVIESYFRGYEFYPRK